jgi:hypothetical protein
MNTASSHALTDRMIIAAYREASIMHFAKHTTYAHSQYAKLTESEPLMYFDPPTEGEPVITIKHPLFGCLKQCSLLPSVLYCPTFCGCLNQCSLLPSVLYCPITPVNERTGAAQKTYLTAT